MESTFMKAIEGMWGNTTQRGSGPPPCPAPTTTSSSNPSSSSSRTPGGSSSSNQQPPQLFQQAGACYSHQNMLGVWMHHNAAGTPGTSLDNIKYLQLVNREFQAHVVHQGHDCPLMGIRPFQHKASADRHSMLLGSQSPPMDQGGSLRMMATAGGGRTTAGGRGGGGASSDGRPSGNPMNRGMMRGESAETSTDDGPWGGGDTAGRGSWAGTDTGSWEGRRGVRRSRVRGADASSDGQQGGERGSGRLDVGDDEEEEDSAYYEDEEEEEEDETDTGVRSSEGEEDTPNVSLSPINNVTQTFTSPPL